MEESFEENIEDDNDENDEEPELICQERAADNLLIGYGYRFEFRNCQ